MDAPIRVLYAEDDPRDADLTRTRFALEAPEFDIEIVDTGEAGWERLQQNEYDVLLLDYRLPDMDGIDLLKKLVLGGFRLPTVMVTGLGDEEVVVHALRLGAIDYIPKSGDYLSTLPMILKGIALEYRQRKTLAQPLAPPRRRVLYVERHQMDIDLTLSHFADHAPHFSLTVVKSSADALALLTPGHDFDLVLADLRMPDMSALDFLREARHRGLHMPFIIISGQGDEETAVAALKLGAADYIVKRENYLTHLTYTLDHAIARFQLDLSNVELRQEIAERRRVEAVLRDSEVSFRLLFANNPHPMWVYDL
ncbi:MAG TPA: response regulator, partial [Anaerolineae bacterium]